MFKLIYVPIHFYHSHGYSGPCGPWTTNDTKIAVAILLTIILAYTLVFMLNYLCNKNVRIKDYIYPMFWNEDCWFITEIMYLFTAFMLALGIFGYICYLIYSLL